MSKHYLPCGTQYLACPGLLADLHAGGGIPGGENNNFVKVNGLLCTSAKLNRGPRKNEVILDEADGLDWKAGVRCDFLYALPKEDFVDYRGSVSTPRRREIARKIAECLRLPMW